MASTMGCRTCGENSRPAPRPPRERIDGDEHWRVAHAFGTPLPGWLVLIPLRHVERVADLTGAEAASLGRWQVRLSGAVQEVTGCAKTYLAQFAESPAFRHVHFHVVPRAADLPQEWRGPAVFGLLTDSHEALGEAECDEASLAVRSALAAQRSDEACSRTEVSTHLPGVAR